MKPNVKAFFDPRTFTLTYAVWDPSTRDAVVIDPVLDYEPVGSYTFTESVDEVVAFVRAQGLKVHHSLETHAHADHLSAGQILRRELDARVAIGRRITEVQETFKKIFDLPPGFRTDGGQFDALVSDGEAFKAGSLNINVLATPGHTPACVTYEIGDAIFTGDTLFMDDYGTGRCDFPRGSAEAMYDSIKKLYDLPDETRVFVGHDYLPDGRPLRYETTIGAEKRNNPQLSAHTPREEFVTMRKQRDAQLAAPKLLFQSVQVNVDAGRLPAAHDNGIRYFAMPLNFLRPADELGRPARVDPESKP
jgi:glyoxylase-like metal-dependent hydrolase (beta-lactamase superfamily II)